MDYLEIMSFCGYDMEAADRMVNEMSKTWKKYQPNPCGRSVGDCAVRALSAALEISWSEAYDLLADEGRRQCDMPSADACWGAVLKKHGFTKAVLPVMPYYTAADFVKYHPEGLYVLAFGGHVACVRDGLLLDSWDSSNEVPIYYYYRRT